MNSVRAWPRSPNTRSARRTAAAAMDTDCAPMAVCDRTSCHREGALEHLVQQRAERTGLAGRAHGVLHLAHDLGLAQHHGIQAAGHAEGVTHGVVLVMTIEVRAQGAGVEPVVVGQPGRQLLGHMAVGRAIDLGAVTGREDGGFADRAAEGRAQSVQRGPDQIDGHGHAFANRDRRGRVIQTEGKDSYRHVGRMGGPPCTCEYVTADR